MADTDPTTREQDPTRGRGGDTENVGTSRDVPGEAPNFEAGATGAEGADGGMGTEGAMMDDEQSNTRTASATLSPEGGGVTGRGGAVENADFAASGGTREQNLGRSDQAGTAAKPEGGIQQDRS